eukprot:2968147-Alexandrium_andersonii.AAC.1
MRTRSSPSKRPAVTAWRSTSRSNSRAKGEEAATGCRPLDAFWRRACSARCTLSPTAAATEKSSWQASDSTLAPMASASPS